MDVKVPNRRMDQGFRRVLWAGLLFQTVAEPDDYGRSRHVRRVAPTYWRVTFDNGPVNLLDLDAVDQLAGRPEHRPFAELLFKNGLQRPDGIETDLGTAIGEVRQRPGGDA